jgi:hypothetical protein
MPWYDNDDIECWFKTCWEEEYEERDEEMRAIMRDIINRKSCQRVEEWAAEKLDTAFITLSSLYSAILNTVNWPDLKCELAEWTKDFDEDEELEKEKAEKKREVEELAKELKECMEAGVDFTVVK